MGDTTAAIDAMAAKRQGAVVKLETVSYFSGYSVSALHAMIRDGLPVAKGGGTGKPVHIDCARLIDWLVQRERERVVKEMTGIPLERLQAAGLLIGAGAALKKQGETEASAAGLMTGAGEVSSAETVIGNTAAGEGASGSTTGTGKKERESKEASAGGGEITVGGMFDWKMRRGLVETRIKEIELQKLEGELVEIDALEVALTNLVSIARSRLMALPARTSPLCAAAGDVNEVRRVLEASIREILEELAAESPEKLMAAMSKDGGAEEK
jgi:hypothetical protein